MRRHVVKSGSFHNSFTLALLESHMNMNVNFLSFSGSKAQKIKELPIHIVMPFYVEAGKYYMERGTWSKEKEKKRFWKVHE